MQYTISVIINADQTWQDIKYKKELDTNLLLWSKKFDFLPVSW